MALFPVSPICPLMEALYFTLYSLSFPPDLYYSSPNLNPILLDLELDLDFDFGSKDLELKALYLDLDSDLKVLPASLISKSFVPTK